MTNVFSANTAETLPLEWRWDLGDTNGCVGIYGQSNYGLAHLYTHLWEPVAHASSSTSEDQDYMEVLNGVTTKHYFEPMGGDNSSATYTAEMASAYPRSTGTAGKFNYPVHLFNMSAQFLPPSELFYQNSANTGTVGCDGYVSATVKFGDSASASIPSNDAEVVQLWMKMNPVVDYRDAQTPDSSISGRGGYGAWDEAGEAPWFWGCFSGVYLEISRRLNVRLVGKGVTTGGSWAAANDVVFWERNMASTLTGHFSGTPYLKRDTDYEFWFAMFDNGITPSNRATNCAGGFRFVSEITSSETHLPIIVDTGGEKTVIITGTSNHFDYGGSAGIGHSSSEDAAKDVKITGYEVGAVTHTVTPSMTTWPWTLTATFRDEFTRSSDADVTNMIKSADLNAGSGHRHHHGSFWEHWDQKKPIFSGDSGMYIGPCWQTANSPCLVWGQQGLSAWRKSTGGTTSVRYADFYQVLPQQMITRQRLR